LVTKLRDFNTKLIIKILAFVLCVICITGVVTQVQYAGYKNFNPECLFVKDYLNSQDFINSYVQNAIYDVSNLATSDNKTSTSNNYYYYVNNGKKIFSNTKETKKSYFEKYDKASYYFENGIWTAGKHTNSKIKFYNSYFNNGDHSLDSRYTVYIAFRQAFTEKMQQQWQENRNKLIPIVINLVVMLILALLMVVFLICVTGRKPHDKELHMSKLDYIYSDVWLGTFIMLVIFWINGVSDLISYYRNQQDNLGIYGIYSIIKVGALTVFVSVCCGIIILSLVRKIKAGKLIKHSLTYSVCFAIYDFFRSFFDGRRFAKYSLTKSLFYRQLTFIIASAILVFFTFVFLMAGSWIIIPPLMELAVIYWYVKGNNKTFDEINKGFNESLEDQMKAERMKIALVTNVSHDLKTPLTSIISYVDLLSKDESLSEEAMDYVKILAEKSNRLKTIVADLFDLAKSTSGNISLEVESLDIKKLIEQTLADMGDEIEKSGLHFKTKLPDKPVNIMADGKKIYRVIQNIIDNALKYSLVGTRVFVELEESDGKIYVTVKNTAAYEMNFTAEEILQRFNRGDQARTTEGSGLGLSIAESFTNVCGGSFKVDVDGDLFKVTIGFRIK
jgi:signal transduction histidine kinase